MDTSPGVEGPNSVGGGNVWFKAADGERQAIRVDSRDTQGAYAVIESVAEPGCAGPTHRHCNEEEHFLVISGRYRMAIGDQILDAPPGTRATSGSQPCSLLGQRHPTTTARDLLPGAPFVRKSSNDWKH
jgi:hypothetical protein